MFYISFFLSFGVTIFWIGLKSNFKMEIIFTAAAARKAFGANHALFENR